MAKRRRPCVTDGGLSGVTESLLIVLLSKLSLSEHTRLSHISKEFYRIAALGSPPVMTFDRATYGATASRYRPKHLTIIDCPKEVIEVDDEREGSIGTDLKRPFPPVASSVRSLVLKLSKTAGSSRSASFFEHDLQKLSNLTELDSDYHLGHLPKSLWSLRCKSINEINWKFITSAPRGLRRFACAIQLSRKQMGDLARLPKLRHVEIGAVFVGFPPNCEEPLDVNYDFPSIQKLECTLGFSPHTCAFLGAHPRVSKAIRTLRLIDDGVVFASGLNLPTLRRADILANIVVVAGLFPLIDVLDLSQSDFDNQDMAHVTATCGSLFQSIHTLDIGDNRFTNCEFLPTMPKLTMLNLSNNRSTQCVISSLSTSTPNLTHLNLVRSLPRSDILSSSNGISTFFPANLPHLRHLQFGSGELPRSAVIPEIISAIVNLYPHLESLSVPTTVANDYFTLGAIARLGPTLRELDLSWLHGLTPVLLMHLLKSLVCLQKLTLSSTLRDSHRVTLSMLQKAVARHNMQYQKDVIIVESSPSSQYVLDPRGPGPHPGNGLPMTCHRCFTTRSFDSRIVACSCGMGLLCSSCCQWIWIDTQRPFSYGSAYRCVICLVELCKVPAMTPVQACRSCNSPVCSHCRTNYDTLAMTSRNCPQCLLLA